MDDLLAEAQRVIGIEFGNTATLELALRHASHTDSRLDSNERLEFLGDAVLGVIVCERIFERFPNLLEGEMTKIKSTVVSRKTCADISERMGLDTLLVLGKGMQTQASLPRSLAAAVLESVVAAVYLELGFEGTKAFLLPLIDPEIDEAERSGHQQNFKSVLQQHAQHELGQSPCYRVLDEKGPDHAKCFKVAVEIAGEFYPSCWGQAKKQAEQLAAEKALFELGVLERDQSGRTMLASSDGDDTGAASEPAD